MLLQGTAIHGLGPSFVALVVVIWLRLGGSAHAGNQSAIDVAIMARFEGTVKKVTPFLGYSEKGKGGRLLMQVV
jgi:hypothetical protein